MKVVTQHHIGTTDEWKIANPKLYEAVWAFEKTKDGKVLAKLGNGKDLWNDLKYFDIDNIHGLSDKLQEAVEIEAQARRQADQALREAIDEILPEGIESEAQARADADQELREAIDNEAHVRQLENQNYQALVEAEVRKRRQGDSETLNSAKSHVDSSISQTNENLQALQTDFNAWIGRGGYLTAFDFGTPSPLQEDLCNEALSQITSITDPLQIWNGTKIKNLNNGHTWILTNTQDTDPPIFEWNDQGPGDLAAFGKNMGGYVVGADPDTDGPEYVFPQLGGKGKINLDAIKQMLFDMEHPVGDVVEQMPGALSPIDKH